MEIIQLEAQWEMLKYLLKDKDAFNIVPHLNYDWYVLDEQKIIVDCIKKCLERKGKIPKNPRIFNTYLLKTIKTKRWSDTFDEDSTKDLFEEVSDLYGSNLIDGREIEENIRNFISYHKTREALDKFDINQIDTYERLISQLNQAHDISKLEDFDLGTDIIGGLDQRIKDRENGTDDVIATPLRQLNMLTNGGGFTKGSVITVMDKGKGGKTAFFVSLAMGYLLMGKNVLIIDLENGETNYATRFDQNISKSSKREVRSGESNKTLIQQNKKLKRKGEIKIKRFPAGTTANTIESFIERVYRDTGLKFDVCLIDYIAQMGSSDGEKDDTTRISKAYVQCKNIAEKYFECMWTPHHTVREAMKRRATCYEPNDTAKCIDVHRHVDGMLGLNQNEVEEEAGIIRLEIVDLRDGKPSGSSYFWQNIEHQRVDEMTEDEVGKVKNMKPSSKSKSKSDLD